MKKSVPLFTVIILLAYMTLSVSGCGCGFDCNNGNNPGNQDPASFTLGFSDEALEQLKQVVIEVEQIAFTRNVGDDSVCIRTWRVIHITFIDSRRSIK